MFFLKMENNQKILGDLNLSRAALSQWLMQKCKSSALVYNFSVRTSLKNKAKIGTYLEIVLPPLFFFLLLLYPTCPTFSSSSRSNYLINHIHVKLFACLLVGQQPKTFWLLTSQVVVKITQESENGYFLLGKGPSHDIFLLSFSRMRYMYD